MAITKMLHIGGSSYDLKRSIHYIMNPEKTERGALVGGSCGTRPDDVFRVMMNTKELFDKVDKRQGYHFVISWKPGEITKEPAYEIGGEFCKEYLGDQYDYVYAVHTDKDHLHVHIVFNSVNRLTEYKYRYEKGDWEKFIQPITDYVCKKHGISGLNYDPDNPLGKSYVERDAEKKGLPTLTKIVKADIDLMIARSDSFDEFITNMKRLGYQVRMGKYITYTPPGMKKGRRDKTLGEGYSKSDIEARILAGKLLRNGGERNDEETVIATSVMSKNTIRKIDNYLGPYLRIKLTGFQKRRIWIVYRSAHYLEARNPFAVRWYTVRKDAMDIQKLFQECQYLLENHIGSVEEMKARYPEAGRKERSMIKRILKREADQQLRTGMIRERRKQRSRTEEPKQPSR